MSHAPTGPGRITISSNAPLGGVRAVLSNYDVDVDALKTEHIAFLDGSVVPIVTGSHSRIWLQGQASHTGTASHNLELSHRRALRVSEFLKTRGVLAERIQVDWVGDSLAGPRGEQDGQRAVSLLAATLGTLPRPTPPPQPAPASPTNTVFQIRLLGALSGGLGPVSLERLFFQIWDQRSAVTSFYLYSSAGFGKSRGAAMSATLRGPWNQFTTTGPLGVEEFGGAARFTTGGVGPWTVNYLNMMGLPRGLATSPRSLKISTGFTVGLGMSSTVGELTLGLTGPFTGP